MRYNISKLLTNFIEITEEKYQARKKVHKIDKEDVKFRKNSVNNKMEARIFKNLVHIKHK